MEGFERLGHERHQFHATEQQTLFRVVTERPKALEKCAGEPRSRTRFQSGVDNPDSGSAARRWGLFYEPEPPLLVQVAGEVAAIWENGPARPRPSATAAGIAGVLNVPSHLGKRGPTALDRRYLVPAPDRAHHRLHVRYGTGGPFGNRH
jgi:hypothetical protein